MGVKRRVGEVGPAQVPVLEATWTWYYWPKRRGRFGSEVRSWFGHSL